LQTQTTQPVVELEAPSNAAPQVKDETAAYPDVFPGVDVVYTSVSEGLKEELVLAGPTAASSYYFTVMSPGLTAEPTAAGGIAFVDNSGKRWGHFAPPFAHDASFPSDSHRWGHHHRGQA
jgi:hypothetical protein